MNWSDGLDRTLAVMLACVTSTESVGDQLWVRVIGPASCGKTTLCDGLGVAKKYVIQRDTMTSLVSGYQMGDGSENLSLVKLLKNMTLVINDGDTIVSMPNRERLMSQLRAFYSRNLRTQFGNKMSADHEGYNATVVFCGTTSLYTMDTSEMGERFVDSVVVESIDADLERDTALRTAYRQFKDMSRVSDGSTESRDGPDLVEAKRLTGGYVEHLRQNAQELLSQVTTDDVAMESCVNLGALVAYMRARPSSKQDEKAERELCYRLTGQMVRLATCLAVVLGRKSIDPDVIARTSRVAMDTARGRTFELARHLYEAGDLGRETPELSNLTGETDDKVRVLLRFLKKIGVVEYFQPVAKVRLKPRWRLTNRVRKLYEEVVGK